MVNRRNPLISERKEPQLTPLIDEENHMEPSLADSLRESAHNPMQGHTNTSARGRPVGAKTGLLWTSTLLLTCGLIGVAGYGVVELDRVRGIQTTLLERVQVLSNQSDQIGSKLTSSDGAIEQTQTSLLASVETLEKGLKAELAGINKQLNQQQTQLAEFQNLKTQLAQQIKEQVGPLEASITAARQQVIAGVEQQNKAQLEKIQALEKQVSQTITEMQALLKKESAAVEQSMAILREEVSEQPLARMTTLQDQFATYMQSVDQFRQQTNASLNELSGQLREVSRDIEVRQRQVNDVDMTPSPGFGVEVVQ